MKNDYSSILATWCNWICKWLDSK